jgi:hypothetical protein
MIKATALKNESPKGRRVIQDGPESPGELDMESQA